MLLKIAQIIILVCIGVISGVKGGLGPSAFWKLRNVFLLVSSWWNKILPLLVNTGKIHYYPPGKTLPTAKLVYVQIRVSQTFCISPTIHQIYHYATPHLRWCNNTIVQKRQWFSVSMDQIIWARVRAKIFRYLEPQPESEISVLVQQPCFGLF